MAETGKTRKKQVARKKIQSYITDSILSYSMHRFFTSHTQTNQLIQEEMNEQQLTNAMFFTCLNPSTKCFSLTNLEIFRMKKTLTFLSIFAFVALFVTGTNAQIHTVKGDFWNITRTIEQTADSVTFVADTLTLADSGGGVANFLDGDSVVVFFAQNRFKIVNNMLTSTLFDYIRVRVGSTSTGMSLSHEQYTGVVVNTSLPLGADPAVYNSRDIGIRPVYRYYGPIASSTVINGDPNTIRQMLSFRIQAPTTSADFIQIRNILFKPNINNLTGLAVPPDTAKDTLRAYLLDGGSHGVGMGNVVGNIMKNQPDGADLAIVRLLPGTTRYIVWVKDSAQVVDAGEYIGSFGDYSRGRYFLGDDGLPFSSTSLNHAAFRPGQLRTFVGSADPPVLNPDYGMQIDGLMPERNPLRYTALYQTLAPMWYNNSFDANPYNVNNDPNYPTIPNPNPENGLIPPYRPGEANIAHAGRDYQPGLVSSAVDTLRFFDIYGNRTWDRMTQPQIHAIAYTINNNTPEDRSGYLKGTTSATDTLRQFGQIVYRRLAYTHADIGANQGAVEDSVRILATATVNFVDAAFIPRTLITESDTSGGFPRLRSIGGFNGVDNLNFRAQEAYLDEMGTTPQWNIPNRGRKDAGTWNLEGAVNKANPNGYRTPVDPSGIVSLPNTGVKIVIRPNMPRAIDVRPIDQWKGTADNDFIRLDGILADGFGNTVDDNERYKFEMSPFGVLTNSGSYRLNGLFDSLTNPVSPISISGKNLDTGRVFVSSANLGHFTRVFRHATGSNGIGPYRIRIRASWCENDRGNDVNDPNKVDHFPGTGFLHSSNIPDGSPNNNFGVWFGPGSGWNAGLGDKMNQTVAMDSTDVIWDGSNWTYFQGRQPRIEIVWGKNEAFVVGRVGTFKDSVYEHLYIRMSDIFGNPMDIASYFNQSPTAVTVELPDNPLYYPPTGGSKHFYASVSANIAHSLVYNLGVMDSPDPVATPSGRLLNAFLYNVPANTGLPGIDGDIVVPIYDYNVVKFYLKAPQNVSHLSLAGVDVVRLRAHLRISTIPGVGDFSITSAIAEVSVIPDVVQTVEVFKSWGKPQGTSVPLGSWGPGTVNDRIAAAYPVGTPTGALMDPTLPYQPHPSQGGYNPRDNDMFYTGYFFRSTGASDPPSMTADFPSVMEPMGYSDKGIGSFQASTIDLDHDATTPIPMDTVVVSYNTKQMRIIARVLDKYQNPVGGRLVKFFVESQTLPVTPPKTQLQDNTQRGGFGVLGTSLVKDDTLKRSTIGDTAQAGWVSAYFLSGRVAWQMVRIAVTPDTLAFDLSNTGRNLGEGTSVGPSQRGFAPRVIIPIYQKADTTVRVELFTYAAASTSPIPLPCDTLRIQTLENQTGYSDGQDPAYAPQFLAYSSNALCQEVRATHFNRVANTNIRPYIPDSTGLTSTLLTDPMAVTAGRIVSILAREYDQYGNLVDQSGDDTARVRFRLFGPNFGSVIAPYSGAGTIAPAKDWTRDEYGPMRKARYRHTKVGNLVSGIHINQTANLIALELPTPRTQATIFYVEGTGTVALPQGGVDIAPNVSRDTVKIVTILKQPTRIDILRAGMEFGPMPQTQGGGPGVFALQGPPEARSINPNARNIGLPNGADQIHHGLDAQGYDDILYSQVYKRDVDPNPVGLYEVVNNDDIPLDKNGNTLFLANGSFNPAFQRHPYSGMPIFQKLNARNNRNPQTSPNPSYNDLNNGTTVPGARRDGTIFDITSAGGGDGIGTNSWDGTRDRRPVLFHLTPLWENKAPRDGKPYVVANQPGQTRVYYNRLFSDSVYTFTGNVNTPIKGQITRIEFMGTRTDGGNPAFYEPTVDYNGTRIGVSYWTPADFTRSGYPKSNTLANFRTSSGASMNSGRDIMGNPLADWNRRVAITNWSTEIPGPSGQANAALTICPGAFLRVVDSSAEQVIDLRVVDESLGIDDTVSWDSGKMTVIRRANRAYWFDDTGYELNPADIPGPNQTASLITDQPFPRLNGSGSGSMSPGMYYGPVNYNLKRSTFVVVSYRIAYLSIFPSSFNNTQKVSDLSTLSVGILPEQADIDTLPRVSPTFYNDLYGTPQNQFEVYTRLYGQIKHGSTQDRIPNNGAPYARPDTIFRDQQYVYAVTPYDRYGNMNTRDTMWIQIGARFTNDWELSFSGASDGSSYMVNGGGNYFNAKPINFPDPTSTNLRQDTLRLYNLSYPGIGNRNDYLGIKPDDKRLHYPVGDVGGGTIPDGLIPANVMSSRPVWVKMPFAPAPFILGTNAQRNTALFRLDHTGRCLDATGAVIDGLAKDSLRLQWQASTWQSPLNGQNNPNDTVKYEWYAIIDSIGSTSSSQRTVSVPSDGNGTKPSLTLDGRSLYNLLFRPGYGPHPNADSLVMRLYWFVRAYSKTGLQTYSDTAGYTIRDNPLPLTPPLVISINRAPQGAPQPVTPTDGFTISGISATTPAISVVWTQSTDINNIKGALLGGPFKNYNTVTRAWEKDLNRTIDTIHYQWVGIVASTSPAGKGAPVGTTYVKNAAGTSAGVTIDPSDLTDMFRTFNPDPTSTSADSVKINWRVFVNDFYFNDDVPMEAVDFPYMEGIWPNEAAAFAADTGRWSPFSCQPHILASNTFHLNLTKLDNGGIEFDSQYAGTPDINKLVGQQICFDLVAKDKNGNIIRDWDSPIKANPVTTLVFKNSTANTDTSKQSWSADPLGFSWANITYNGKPLTYDPIKDEFYIPASDFVEGKATICLIDTKAESGVTLTVKEVVAFLTQQISANMNFTADIISNYLVELTPAVGGQTDPGVYLERRFEIVVSPRDRYLNVSSVQMRTNFSARFPGEFDNTLPGLSNIFAGNVFITGPTNYFLASRFTRLKGVNTLQTVRAFSANDPTIYGETAPFEILDHYPTPFALLDPADNYVAKLEAAANAFYFHWVKATPQDPYTNIQISRFDPTTYSDVVTYELRFLDKASLTHMIPFASDSAGVAAKYTTNEGQLAGIIDQMSGLASTKTYDVIWYVNATDGLYDRHSTPDYQDPQNRPGYHLTLTKDQILGTDNVTIPTDYQLSQNYPNPFNPTTSISYSMPKAGQVSIVVYDLLGAPVKTLVNQFQTEGNYSVTWDGTNNLNLQLNSGHYMVKMVAGNYTSTRKMTMMK
jgi:hypothetical protein